MENATRNPVAFSFFSLYFPPSVTVTLYSYYFFNFYFIYKVRIYTRARKRKIKKSCGLRVAFSEA